ncbi:MAG: hypothetical protein KJS90_07375 [Acidobacteria bacterium]|nr:hypothetical protein [Acidobacteriota bacterium]
MPRRSFAASLLFVTALFAPPAHGTQASTGPCTKQGAVRAVKKVQYVCTKSGKRLAWRRATDPLASLVVPRTVGAMRPGAEGPAIVRVVLRSSTDGTSFAGNDAVMDQAGVPNLLAASDGALYAYYQDWANGNVMGVAVTRNGVRTHYLVRIDGIDTTSMPQGVDPSAVQLSDGRIRLYWMMSRGGPSKIYSATSTTGATNGIVFTYDGGVAFDAGTMVFDPTVVRTASGWSMWVDRGGTAQHATSTDGLTFVAADNSVFPNSATFPWGGTTLPDGRIRVVASVRGPGGADGLLFESNDGGRSYVQIASGLVPPGAPADTGLTYLNGTWWLLNSERM